MPCGCYLGVARRLAEDDVLVIVQINRFHDIIVVLELDLIADQKGLQHGSGIVYFVVGPINGKTVSHLNRPLSS